MISPSCPVKRILRYVLLGGYFWSVTPHSVFEYKPQSEMEVDPVEVPVELPAGHDVQESGPVVDL